MKVGLEESGLPLPFPSVFPPLNQRSPCHAPQKSPNTSWERVVAVGVSGGLDVGRMFRPTSSGSTGPDTAPGLSGGSGSGGPVGVAGAGVGFSGGSAGAIFIGGHVADRSGARLAAMRRDFAAHPLPPVLVLPEKHREPDLDGFPEDVGF